MLVPVCDLETSRLISSGRAAHSTSTDIKWGGFALGTLETIALPVVSYRNGTTVLRTVRRYSSYR